MACPPLTFAPTIHMLIAPGLWSRPTPRCEIGMRPNSPCQITSVESSRPRAFKSVTKPAIGTSTSLPCRLWCMPVRFFINLAYVISNFQPDAVGAEAPHHKACKAQPNEDPPGLRREEIRHPRSPGGLVARHDGRCRVAVEIEAHCDECFLAGGARGGKHRTR